MYGKWLGQAYQIFSPILTIESKHCIKVVINLSSYKYVLKPILTCHKSSSDIPYIIIVHWYLNQPRVLQSYGTK